MLKLEVGLLLLERRIIGWHDLTITTLVNFIDSLGLAPLGDEEFELINC